METTNSSLQIIPEPRAGSAYSFGWGKMKKYFLYAFVITILMGIIMSPLGIDEYYKEGHYRITASILLQIFVTAYFFFVLAPIRYGAKFVFLKIVREQDFDIKEVFDGFKNYLNIILANILVASLVGFGIVFLLVPGIIIACRLALVPYIVMDKKIDPIKAVELSWQMTKGHGWTIFGMAMLAIPIFIAGIICFGVGVIVSIMWIYLAFASIYYSIDSERNLEISNEEKVLTT